MQSKPKVTLLVIELKNSTRWIEVSRLVRELTSAGAAAHADKPTQRYCADRQFFDGDFVPAELRDNETRVIARIEPVKISMDAIFKSVHPVAPCRLTICASTKQQFVNRATLQDIPGVVTF